MKVFIEEQVATGSYRTASTYVEQLIREAKERKQGETAHLEALLLEGIDYSSPVPATEAFWQQRRDALAANLGKASRRE